MLEFFIIFVITGFIIGKVQEQENVAVGIIVIISILWMFVFGFWAIATFIELLLGYGIAKKINIQ